MSDAHSNHTTKTASVLADEHRILPHRCDRCGLTANTGASFRCMTDGSVDHVLYQCESCGSVKAYDRRWVLAKIRRMRKAVRL